MIYIIYAVANIFAKIPIYMYTYLQLQVPHRAWSCHWAHCRGWGNSRACPGSWSDHRAVPLGTVHLPWEEFFSFSHHSSWNSYRSCNRSDHRAHCEGRSDSGVCHKAWSNLVGPIARIGAAAGSVPGVGEAAALSADPALFPLRMLKSAEHSSVVWARP